MTATRSLSDSVQNLNRVLLASELTDLPDSELVGRFVERRDEVAFAALVRRHGALVFGVCRRVLRHEQDAEDAFQATFLVFARDAASVRQSGSVGNWLYGVAYNVARRAKTARGRRAVKEHEAASRNPTEVSEVVPDDLRDVLDRELSALPEKYRAAVVLCDLTGLTTEQAATEVGCPPKTLGTRLARGRARLARRLGRLSTALPAGGLMAVTVPSATAAAPPGLVEFTVRVVVESMAGSPAAVGPSVAALAKGASNVMALKSLKTVAVLACGSLLACGVALHGGFSAPATPAASAGLGSPAAPQAIAPRAEHVPADPIDHFHRFLGHLYALFGFGTGSENTSDVRADDKKDAPNLAGKWESKTGQMRIEFTEKNVVNISPHGNDKEILIVCDYTAEKDGLVKVKITGIEGKDELRKVIAEKLPVGTEFKFKWKVKADTATLGDVEGDKDTADLLKTHLEGEYTKK
jgi:RNA polymerase sigma factor (sigma-70 family)